jgi:hypothetical protein
VARVNQGVMVLTAIMITISAASPVHAVTCEDVRSLTRAEQEYWSKRLNLTAEQRYKIWRACYGSDQHHRPKLMPINSH